MSKNKAKRSGWREVNVLPDTLSRLGRERFVRLDHIIYQDPSREPFLACLLTAPLDLSTLLISSDPVALPLLNVYTITSYGVPCGWMFEFPRLIFKYHQSFMRIYAVNMAKNKLFSNVEQVFSNSRFSVFSSEDKSTLVTLNRQSLITWE